MIPEDDYPHSVGPEPTFNESMYFHFYDPRAGIGGFVRLANRPNEGRGERTVCLYLPDGRLGFAFARPEGTSNDEFDAAGLRFDVREPLQHIEISFVGQLFILDDPALLADPKRVWTTSPNVDCEIDLHVRGLAPPFEHSFDTGEGSFAPNHYEQLLAAKGTVRVDQERTDVDGHGLRDHSWGPRSWQAPWFYRWIHGSAEGFGFMGALFGRPEASAIRGGFVWDGAQIHTLDRIDISTVRDRLDEHTDIIAILHAEQQHWKIEGRVESKVPLRNRRQDDRGGTLTTRIVEGLTSWSLEDGRTLYGMSEYLDQIVDGRPVGLAV